MHYNNYNKYTAINYFVLMHAEFIVDPEDRTVEINDTNVEFTCTPGLNTEQVITWQIFLSNGTFWSVTAADPELQRHR